MFKLKEFEQFDKRKKNIKEIKTSREGTWMSKDGEDQPKVSHLTATCDLVNEVGRLTPITNDKVGKLRARSIRPKFLKIPVQNRMEQKFPEIRFENFGSPLEVVIFSGNLEIPEISGLFHLAFLPGLSRPQFL